MQTIFLGQRILKKNLKKYAVKDNIKSIADAKKIKVGDVTACVLERSRHNDQIESLRSIGAKIVFNS